MTFSFAAFPKSSLVCPSAYGIRTWTLTFQYISVLLNVAIVVLLQRTLSHITDNKPNLCQYAPFLIGFLCIVGTVSFSLVTDADREGRSQQ